MTLCVFALIASEFLPVSLLTPLAADLHVTEGLAGQGISISAVFAVMTSLSIARLAGGMDRKTLLLGLTALMCLSGVVVATAGSYWVYMLGRALIGVVVGGFWSLSTATAMRLVPRAQLPKALALINGGNALATVVAAPLGSYIGAVAGWRGAFLCLVPVAVVAFVWQWRSLPAMRVDRRAGPAGVMPLLRRPEVALGMLAVSIFFMGQFTLFTYVRPFLESATHVAGTVLSWVLLGIGVAGLGGTTVAGGLNRWGLYTGPVLIPLSMAVIAALLTFVAPWLGLTAGLLACWGFLATPAPVAWWTWLARTAPDSAEAGGGLLVAVVQMAIGLGSALGGLLFDAHGFRSTFWAASVLLLVAAGLALLTARVDRTVPA